MSFLELARKRCSIRKYAPKNVEQEKIDYILEAARLAPSAVNFNLGILFGFKVRKEKLNYKNAIPGNGSSKRLIT